VRDVLERVLDDLLARYREAGHVHLDDLAAAIGVNAVSQDEVDELVSRLEAEGLRVGEDLDERDMPWISDVLASARRLAAALGRRPTVDEIAADCGKPARAVRRALEHVATARPAPSSS
jgi:hypothetical protein